MSSLEKIWKKFQAYCCKEKKKGSEKAAYCVIPVIKHSGKSKTIEMINGSVITRIFKGGNVWESLIRKSTENFLG